MTIIEAKKLISDELISSFLEYIKDWDDMPDFEFGQKYGYGKGSAKPGMTFKSLNDFMSEIFGGRYLPGWEKAGYPKEIIFDLHREGWLSYQCYTNYRARMTGKTEWYYIPQRTAREIWKAYKEAQAK